MSRATTLASALILLQAVIASAGQLALYELEVQSTWSTTTHPGLFPENAHFSWLGGGTHRSDISFWQEGQLASPGMVEMAETGVTDILKDEMNQAVAAGDAFSALQYRWWFCPTETDDKSCGETSVTFQVDTDFPAATFVTMLGPSPDWFVGVSGLELRNEQGWIDSISVDLFPYDGGTRSNNIWELYGPYSDPPEAISLITEESGQLVGPASLGTFTFTRISPNCDFNSDLTCDVFDIDEFSQIGQLPQETTATTSELDLTSDGVVDLADLGEWLKVAAEHNGFATPYRFGDSNLDGTIDGLDRAAWTANRFTDGGHWWRGDFNADGLVDGTDFNLMNQSLPAAETTLVPEPSLHWQFIVLAIGTLGLRKRS